MRTIKGQSPRTAARLFKTTAIAVIVAASAAAVPAYASSGGIVVNPGFETGDFTGWTTEGGSVGSTSFPIDLGWFTSSPASRATIVTAGGNDSFTTNGIDNITGMPTLFAGNFGARINDPVNDYSAVALKQTITGYSASKLYYAWNAVLEPSHGENDSPAFLIKVTDKTSSKVLSRDVKFSVKP